MYAVTRYDYSDESLSIRGRLYTSNEVEFLSLLIIGLPLQFLTTLGSVLSAHGKDGLVELSVTVYVARRR